MKHRLWNREAVGGEAGCLQHTCEVGVTVPVDRSTKLVWLEIVVLLNAAVG